MKPRVTLPALAAALALSLTGCASRAERQAFARYRGIESSTYGGNPISSNDGTDLPVLDEKSTLSDYLAYAALTNPGLRAAFNEWKAALERIPQARALPDPKFTYGYYIQQVETRVGPQRHRFGIYQAFPWYGKLMTLSDMELEAANAAEKRYEAKKLKLFYEVKDAYYEYYYLGRAIAITRENMELMTYLEKVARTRYKVGAAENPDVIKAQIELGKLDDRLRELIALKEPTVAKLNAAMNRPVQMPLPEPVDIPEETIEASDAELIAWLKGANPELQAIAFEIEKEKDAISLARQEYIPDIALGFEWIETGADNIKSSDRGKDPLVASIAIDLPIWYHKYKAAEREARARYLMAQNELADKENSLLYDVKLALFDYRDAGRKINLYRDTLIPKGEQSLKATEAAYASAKLDFLNLIDAERILLEFQLSNERALADHAQGLARLEMLVGREIPAVGDEATEKEQEKTEREGGDRGAGAALPPPTAAQLVPGRAEETGND